MEREAREQGKTASSSALQSKEKGKVVIETYGSGQSSQEMEVLQRGEEFKLGLAKLSSQLRTYVEEAEADPEKKKNQLVVVQTQKIPQQVAMDQQGLEIGAPILQDQLPLQASLIRQVDFESERKIEIHYIDSDLEEWKPHMSCQYCYLDDIICVAFTIFMRYF